MTEGYDDTALIFYFGLFALAVVAMLGACGVTGVGDTPSEPLRGVSRRR